MSKLKKLAEIHEKYNISLEHKFERINAADVATIKATIVIPGENNTFLKRISTNFTPGTTLQEAEELAVDEAISMLLGNKLTRKLTEKFNLFDLQLIPFTGASSAPVGVKAKLIVCSEDGKPFRIVESMSTGTELKLVEAEALKSAIDKVLGV